VHIRTRKLIGTALMIVLVLGWALFFMALAQGRISEAGRFWQALYYVIAGLGWVVPAGMLIKWMSRPD
jgi:Protein of unknown function (DUF2842)